MTIRVLVADDQDIVRSGLRMILDAQLDIEVVLKRVLRGMAQYLCEARVDGKTVASAEILCAEGR